MDKQLEFNIMLLCKEIMGVLSDQELSDRRKAINIKKLADRISVMMKPIVYRDLQSL